MIGQPFDQVLRALSRASFVPDDDHATWAAAAEAAARIKAPHMPTVVLIHDQFDPAMVVLDEFDRWLDAQRDDLDSASSALDAVRAQLAAIRRHQDHDSAG